VNVRERQEVGQKTEERWSWPWC